MKHVLSAGQFEKAELQEILDHADYMKRQKEVGVKRRALDERLRGRLVALLFYEPSTRTRLSFSAAAQLLGAKVVETENAEQFSSAAKGETLEDTIRVVDKYSDAIVIRHHQTGAAARAAAVSRVPILNAGDGTGEHPTQALLDMHTIRSELGRLDDLHVVIGGDLRHGRAARSLARLLALYKNNRITFVSTPELAMGDDIKDYLTQQHIDFTETSDLPGALTTADAVYWTRLQKERLSDPSLEAGFTLGQTALDALPEHAIIMHPLPRVGEIETVVDADPRAAYFRQAENGLYLRMALLDMTTPA